MDVWGEPATERFVSGEQGFQRRAMGAAERRRWSTLMRQEEIETVIDALESPQLHGAVILGPLGVGKSALARSIAKRLAATTHVVQLFGSGTASEVPYTAFPLQLARLNAYQTTTPAALLGGLVEQIAADAQGRSVVLILDDLPGIDTLSMGVLMHLVLGSAAKLLVVARTTAALPEDLLWMLKDGLLAQLRLLPFSRAEVRTLMVKALGGPVTESVVASLFTASAGNPLLLQNLVHEYVHSGVLRSIDGVWVSIGQLNSASDDVLFDLVEARMSRETASVRHSVEKFSLFRKLPLALAMQVIGPDALSSVEERGFLSIGSDQSRMVTFAEPYIAETLRGRLTEAQKSAYFQELTDVLALDADTMGMQELLAFAGWIIEAGMVLCPEVAIAAAQSALQYFDPPLAIACSAQVPADHLLAVQAMQNRSRAYFLMANYAKAAEVLESLDPAVLAALPVAEFASWGMDLSVALMWIPGSSRRIAGVLAEVEQRIRQAPDEDKPKARRFFNLARFELHMHTGDFAAVVGELEEGSKDSEDPGYRISCASMLTMTLAVMGREGDATELSRATELEKEAHSAVVRMTDWGLYGNFLALLWSGQWRTCEAMLRKDIEYSNEALHYRGGAMEMALGVVYAFSGRYSQSAEILLTAAAQLEIRDTYNSLELVYSCLAYVYTQLDDKGLAGKYLTIAQASNSHTAWLNQTLSEYFGTLAMRSLGDENAGERLMETAARDSAAGRFTPAAMGLLHAAMDGVADSHGLLAEAASRCQGALAGIGVLLATAYQDDDAQCALDAAAGAGALELESVARHSSAMALKLATASGNMRLAKEARHGLRDAGAGQSAQSQATVVPLTPRELQVARLAIKRMTNRVIAAKIGVSVRTVEGHLYQVFAKLGITSRGELEKWVDL